MKEKRPMTVLRNSLDTSASDLEDPTDDCLFLLINWAKSGTKPGYGLSHGVLL